MGHKVHPFGFRIGIVKDWRSRWYDEKHYAELVHEDIDIRRIIQSSYQEAGISQIEIERKANEVTVTVHTARPGVVIGRGGQRVDELRLLLEKHTEKKIRLNIQEIREPELDAMLVAQNIAEQLRRRVSYRRAVKQSVSRTMLRGAKGVKIKCSGRLGGAEIARHEVGHEGSVPLHTLRADIDYGFAESLTAMGLIGVKVWIYKGDILPEASLVEEEEGEEVLVEKSEE
ncbi:MAG: 30S ribosomal protein S3 [Dehalococcoidia bacterium]|nr:MAG: 30S ribosomal protein S3 [Dehalococcoidia bacterium]